VSPATSSTAEASAPIYRRAVVYCLVPVDLADRHYHHLRDWFEDDSQITVAVERRAGRDRRQGDLGAPNGSERRSGADRRGERSRESTAAIEGLDLPWSVQRHAEQLRLVLSPVPVHPEGWDREAQEYITRARAGEVEMLEELYLHHYDRVRHQVERSVGERHSGAATEEVFQVALDRVMDPVTQTPTGFSRWLSALATDMTRGNWHVR